MSTFLCVIRHLSFRIQIFCDLPSSSLRYWIGYFLLLGIIIYQKGGCRIASLFKANFMVCLLYQIYVSINSTIDILIMFYFLDIKYNDLHDL